MASPPDDPPVSPPDPAKLRRLLDLLPEIEATTPPFGEWFEDKPNPGPDGVYHMPLYGSALISRLMQALYAAGLVVPFDWPAWQNDAESYYREPERLRTADFTTIRHLLTLHARKDRFCEGHLGGMLDDGHTQLILRRLKELVEAGDAFKDERSPGRPTSP